ncbi:heavy metal-binding domain-containing protein [Thiobacillus sp.]
MNFKQLSKNIVRVLASASLFAALGGIAPGFASQMAAHDATSTATAAIRTAGTERPESLAPKNGEGDWTCPMHPEIHRHEAGKCPVCKMKLIKNKPKDI